MAQSTKSYIKSKEYHYRIIIKSEPIIIKIQIKDENIHHGIKRRLHKKIKIKLKSHKAQ